MPWLWIDCITDHEPNQRLVATKEISIDDDYISEHIIDGTEIMPFSLMIEGMAQTAGILVGSTCGFKEKVILAKISRASLSRDVVVGDTIRFDTSIDRLDNLGASTLGSIDRRIAEGNTWERVGRVDLLFSHIDNNMAGTEFPDHNFVFSDNFKTILDTAGLSDLVEE